LCDARIGSIGSTQGVQLNSSPSMKEIGSTVGNEPDFNALSMRPESFAFSTSDSTQAAPACGGPDVSDALSARRAVRVSGA
jgi:hypothetical protein